MLILNLKTFTETSGKNLEIILNEINGFAEKEVYIAPEISELADAKEDFPNFKIISQNVDSIESGKSTGWIPAENLLENGIEISIFNHSEHRVWDENIVNKITSIQAKGLKLIVCCQSIDEAKILVQAKPFALAYEPPDLIGTGISVTTRPQLVSEFISITPSGIIPIIGAGITSGEDVRTAVQLGAKGVLVASAFTKAENHKEKLMELLGGFNT